jgi:predicted transcriptional regulator
MNLNSFLKIPDIQITHLAILINPYLDKIFDLTKPIESRWYLKKTAPYDLIHENDLILFKLSGGAIFGKALVEKVKQYHDLTPIKVRKIMTTFEKELQIDDEYYELKKNSRYAILIWLKDVEKFVKPITIDKTDRQSWVVNYVLPEIIID